jgi:hypothetical protein
MGSFLSRGAVHDWVGIFSQGRSKVKDDVRPRAEVGKTTVKRLLRCGFRRTGTRVSMSAENTSRNKCSALVRISHILSFISTCGLFTDPSSYLSTKQLAFELLKIKFNRYFSCRLHDKIVYMHRNY